MSDQIKNNAINFYCLFHMQAQDRYKMINLVSKTEELR